MKGIRNSFLEKFVIKPLQPYIDNLCSIFKITEIQFYAILILVITIPMAIVNFRNYKINNNKKAKNNCFIYSFGFFIAFCLLISGY